MKTKLDKVVIARLEKHRERISKERDALRVMADEITDLIDATERGLESLDDAIQALSELA